MRDELRVLLVALIVGISAATALIPASGAINWRSIIIASSQAVVTSIAASMAIKKKPS